VESREGELWCEKESIYDYGGPGGLEGRGVNTACQSKRIRPVRFWCKEGAVSYVGRKREGKRVVPGITLQQKKPEKEGDSRVTAWGGGSQVFPSPDSKRDSESVSPLGREETEWRGSWRTGSVDFVFSTGRCQKGKRKRVKRSSRCPFWRTQKKDVGYLSHNNKERKGEGGERSQEGKGEKKTTSRDERPRPPTEHLCVKKKTSQRFHYEKEKGRGAKRGRHPEFLQRRKKENTFEGKKAVQF